MKASSGMSSGAIAGIIIAVLAAVGLAVGIYMHTRNKAREAASLLKNTSDHGFDDENL